MFYEKKISSSMHERKRMDVSLSLKALDSAGRFAGYASVFDVTDSQKDVVVRGAFRATLAGRVPDIKLLWQHAQHEPIGVFERMFEDTHGLYVEGRLLLEVQRAKEAYALLKAGVVSGLSIGYSPIRYGFDEEKGVRILHEVELWEVSLVTFPANSAAGVTVVKHAEPELGQAKLPPYALVGLSDALDRALAALD
jgi:uncharacterized protein